VNYKNVYISTDIKFNNYTKLILIKEIVAKSFFLFILTKMRYVDQFDYDMKGMYGRNIDTKERRMELNNSQECLQKNK
jgi:hypothetical protein